MRVSGSARRSAEGAKEGRARHPLPSHGPVRLPTRIASITSIQLRGDTINQISSRLENSAKARTAPLCCANCTRLARFIRIYTIQ
jgi:hypothetical protein